MQIPSPHGRSLVLGDGRTRLMGIVNATPDSFSDGGRLAGPEAAIEHALGLVAQGAEVIDVGGESTRPGYRPVPVDEQLRRVLPVVEGLRARSEVVISVDTTRAAVADAVLRAGADWINDTSALGEDPELTAVVASTGCPVILMHRFDPPRTEADAGSARDVVAAIARALAERVRHAIDAGIDSDRILLDPGIGFGTLARDCVAIHAHVEELRGGGHGLAPALGGLVFGPSRKSFLGQLTGRPVDERLPATAASVAALALAGVELLRVHDVAAMRDVVMVADAVRAARDW